ncbi:hypothetical protein COU74_03610 [Candidatus Peregrinibacteria bacterium CG10_big_fil_rev_8_21_14_0_10_36_19]|nr:MAG: hypothetical protein COU74_03610 [Candidatus Peregrinibacteria bacterium CG10_big_fil_rev_8_21_14_0_10_36_19]
MTFAERLFAGYLDDGEKILYVAHRHILIFKVKAAKTTFFGLTVPFIGYLLFPQFLVGFLIWAIVGVFGYFYHFLDWYFDCWILTNAGVIDIERNGLFDVTTTRIDYHMIEGIAYTIKGVLQTLFNYGDITIDKLGAKTSVVLKDAANPRRLERIVMRYQEQFIYERSVRDHQALKTMLSDMISYHVHHQMLNEEEDGE